MSPLTGPHLLIRPEQQLMILGTKLMLGSADIHVDDPGLAPFGRI
jgi:hypothetical protein